MKKEQKDCVTLYFNLFKEAMKEEGLIFGIVMDNKDPDASKLAFLDREAYLSEQKTDGITIDLKEMNKGLI